MKEAWKPILLGLTLGGILFGVLAWQDATRWRAYRAEHHCEKLGEQVRFGDFLSPMPHVETIYVCDGGQVVIR